MLTPPPALSTPASALATEIDEMLRRGRLKSRREEKHLLLLDLFLDNEGVLQTLPAEAQRAVMLELVIYWDWEDQNGSLNRQIADYETLIDTLRCATDVFCSWDPSLESLPDQSSNTPEPSMSELSPEQLTLGKFTGLCSQLYREPAFLQQFPPLAMLRQHWGILLPLDHEIPKLPFRAAYAVFPDMRPHHFSITYPKTEPRMIITLTTGPWASKEAIQAEFNRYLSIATSRLYHRRTHYGEQVRDISHYSKLYEVYDLDRAGESAAAIARQAFAEEFKNIKEPFDYTNHAYKNVLGRVTYFLNKAKALINNI
jgi:hypothetical protein